jgi:SAM-dependent methyltransferase
VVLDIGCGNGATSRAAAKLAGRGRVVGIDLSEAMVSNARRSAKDHEINNVEFIHADAQIADLGLELFDLAISRTGAMFFADPVAAFSNIASALKPGGRITLLAWQPYEQNEWQYALADALAMGRTFPKPEVSKPGPMGLADPDFTRHVLATAGFDEIDIEPLERRFSFGNDVDSAFAFIASLGFTKGALEPLSEEDRQIALNQLRASIAEHDESDGVWFGSAAWLISATRR